MITARYLKNPLNAEKRIVYYFKSDLVTLTLFKDCFVVLSHAQEKAKRYNRESLEKVTEKLNKLCRSKEVFIYEQKKMYK